MTKRFAKIVVGLGFGDEGKGTMTEFLAHHHEANLVIRYNGGSQAAHNVIYKGVHHTFSQFGSASLATDAVTLLSQHMLVDPIALSHEAQVLRCVNTDDVLGRLFIDSRAPIITPYHVAANRIKEWYRSQSEWGAHGSCGKGIGETMEDILKHPCDTIAAGDLANRPKVYGILNRLRERKQEELRGLGFDLYDLPDTLRRESIILLREKMPDEITDAYSQMAKEFHICKPSVVNQMIRESNIVMEGAQGVLLDQWHGFHPHTTWSTTTQNNALQILNEAKFSGDVETIGVLRTYHTRHGNGPFPTQDDSLNVLVKRDHNTHNVWQGSFKAGFFDHILYKYALECVKKVGPLDSIAITHMDACGPIGSVSTILPAVSTSYIADIDYINSAICEFSLKPLIPTLVTSIIPTFSCDLGHQGRLRKLLENCRPYITTPYVDNPEEFVSYVSNVADAPVSYLSLGPSLEHKTMKVYR